MSSLTKPTYLYKIVDGSADIPLQVSQLPHVLELSELDKQSGFIHLSNVYQVSSTLKLFFGTFEKVFLLRIPYERVESDIRWEGPTGQPVADHDTLEIRKEDDGKLFPHLYNGLKLGRNEVDGVRVFEKEKSDGWEKVLEEAAAESWLKY